MDVDMLDLSVQVLHDWDLREDNKTNEDAFSEWTSSLGNRGELVTIQELEARIKEIEKGLLFSNFFSQTTKRIERKKERKKEFDRLK